MKRRYRVSLSRLLEAGVDHQETIDARSQISAQSTIASQIAASLVMA